MRTRSSITRVLAFVASLSVPHGLIAAPRLWTPSEVFVGGVGYPNFRSPSITATPSGTLIAIAEGRSFDDPGIGTSDLDIVLRRSTDGGATWSPMQVVDTWTGGSSSNPTTVRDNTTGRLFLLYNRWEGFHGTVDSAPGTNNNTAWVRQSDDDGLTWSSPTNITTAVKDYSNWNAVSFGPGSGIQASNGRLLVPSARWVNGWAGYAVFSTDHGATWARGALTPGGNLSGENQLVQLADGKVLMDARPNTISNPRANFTSTNGGITWSTLTAGQSAPSSQAAIERFSLASNGDDRNRILYTGPRGPTDRQDLVIRASYDEAVSYVNERLLYDGYSGYSDITILPDKSIGVLFETNEARSLTFLRLNREWIEPPAKLQAYEGFRYNTNTLGTKNGGLLWNAGWTGAANLSGAPTTRIENSDLSYIGFPFPIDGQRRAFSANGSGGVMARALPAPIDLNSNQASYLSMLIRQDDVGTDLEGVAEALDISLLSGTVKQIGFGIRGNESLYYDLPGQSGTTPVDTLIKNDVYYLCVKIEPQDSSWGGNRDRIYVKLFRSGDAIPAVDDGLGWSLAGTSGSNAAASIDRIFVRGGTGTNWILDELRFGKSFGSVVSNVLQYRWTHATGGDWGDVANWEDDVPMAEGQLARFGGAISAPATVNLQATRTVGGIAFDNANSYTLSGAAGQRLILNSPSGNCSITVLSGSHAILAPVDLKQNTAISVAAGSRLTLASGITGVAGIALTNSGQGMLEAGNLRVDDLAIAQGTTRILPNGLAAGTSIVRTLSLTSPATLDLTDNSLVIDYAGASPIAQITALASAARNGGTWNGAGLTSSMIDSANGLALGIAEASTLGVSDFGGVAVDASTVLVRYTLLGDADMDRQVEFSDLLRLAQHYEESASVFWTDGDFDYDGTVDFNDLLALAQHYGTALLADGSTHIDAGTQSSFTSDWVLAQSLVPEPSTVGLLCMIVWPLRRRHLDHRFEL